MTHNPRPIIEWLNELPELIRELVISDYDGDEMIVSSMSDAIYFSCSWTCTEIGPLFYDMLHEDALYHEQNNIKLPR